MARGKTLAGEAQFGYRHLFICVLVAFAAGLVVASFAGFREFLPGLLAGAWVTIQITVAASLLAVVCGLLAGLGKLSPWRPVRWLAITYIEIFRGTSALVQLFWLFFVLPHFGLTLDPIPVAILALGLNIGAYGAEVVRGAMLAVPRGQYEAAIALNMSAFTRMRRIILPQAMVAMIPPWGNLFIELLKATALVSLITVSDLTFKAYQLNQATLRTVEIFLAGAGDVSRHRAGDHLLHARARALPGAGFGVGRALMLFDWQLRARDPAAAGARRGGHDRGDRPRLRARAVLGLVLALLRRSQNPWVSTITGSFIEFIRSTPVLIQIFFLFFVFPRFGIIIPAFAAGVLALGLHYACYCSEVYRAGLDGIPRGQWEAATALNLTPARTYWDIIIPQAIPPVVPALGNYLIGMFKETPLLSAIAVLELMQTAKIIGSETFRYLEPITMVGVFFLIMSLVSAAGVRRVEAWLKTRRG